MSTRKTARERPVQANEVPVSPGQIQGHMTPGQIQNVFDTLDLVGNSKLVPAGGPSREEGAYLTYFPVSGTTSAQHQR